MVKKSKNIFEKRNPFSNLNNEKTKKFVKQLDEEDNIRTEILKIEGAGITSVNERILKKIDFSDREFINREISFEKILETEAVKNLAESINEIGLINPVYIIEKKDGKYKILSGFRRLSALYYGYENIKNFNPVGTNNVIIVPENTLREDLTTLEISMKIWRESRNKKKNSEQIAQEYGISRRTVARYLRVEKYPEQLLEKLDEIKNIRKSDTIFNYLNQTNFENMEKNIERLSQMEISDIEREIKKLALNIDDSKIFVKKGKKSTSFEIQGRLTDEEIEKVKQIILKRLF